MPRSWSFSPFVNVDPLLWRLLFPPHAENPLVNKTTQHSAYLWLAGVKFLHCVPDSQILFGMNVEIGNDLVF